jgi:hypothetical protein
VLATVFFLAMSAPVAASMKLKFSHQALMKFSEASTTGQTQWKLLMRMPIYTSLPNSLTRSLNTTTTSSRRLLSVVTLTRIRNARNINALFL